MAPLPIYFAVHYEGNSDRDFLPGIILRTVTRLTNYRERYALDVQDVIVVNDLIDDTGPYKARILRAAQAAAGFTALLLHRDADKRTRAHAKQSYFDPVHEAVRTCSEPVCQRLLPIIPVRCIESWMLVDPSALQQVTGTNVTAAQLELPDQPHQVEAVREPKQALQNAVSAAFRHRRRNTMDISTLYARLADTLDLDRLDRVPSYQQSVSDLEALLVELELIRRAGES